jgi:uncharacterized protein YbaR (Trm112 family)
MRVIDLLIAHRRWGIKRDDIVLDIGSGNKPIFRANILVDKYLDTDLERSSRIIIDRPMVCADGEHLPFRDKSIDFIYCGHLVEHITNPEAFLEELGRVGKRGLIISPNGDGDKAHSEACHLWYIWNKDGKLLLKQKREGNEYPDIRSFILRMISGKGFWKFYYKNFEVFNTIFPWKDKINYEIIRYGEFDLTKFQKAFIEDKSTYTVKWKPYRHRIKSLAGKVVRAIDSSNFDINDILCCPKCKGDLTEVNNNVDKTECKKCGEIYKVHDKILFMDIVRKPNKYT